MSVSRPTILLTNHYTDSVMKVFRSFMPDGFDFHVLEKATHDHLLKTANIADYFLASGRVKIDRAAIDAAPKLKMVQRTGVGLDSIDVNYLMEKDIPLVVNKGINSVSVAEHTLCLMLALLRNLPAVNSELKSGIWKKNETGIRTRSLQGKKVGLIGAGNIGLQVAHMLQPFQTTILYNKPTRLPITIENALSLQYRSLEQLISEADIISLHCPLNDQTRHLFNKQSLSKTKPGVLIINTGRGALLHESDLVEFLTSGHCGGAALDVFENEPLPADSPLFKFPNVITTPHVAGLTLETFSDMMEKAFSSIQKFHVDHNPGHTKP